MNEETVPTDPKNLSIELQHIKDLIEDKKKEMQTHTQRIIRRKPNTPTNKSQSSHRGKRKMEIKLQKIEEQRKVENETSPSLKKLGKEIIYKPIR